MLTSTFLKRYLKASANITLCDDRGNIYYEGPRAGAAIEIYENRELVAVELGALDDIMITFRKEKNS